MRIAIISDVHGNLEALSAVLGGIEANHCDSVVCLGDVVGYGPNPRECIALIKEHCSFCIKGNHDEACATDEFPYWFNSIAGQSILWTRDRLTAAEKSWLGQLPLIVKENGATFVHASVERPESWDYLNAAALVRSSFDATSEPISFIGHTHEPLAWIEKAKRVTVTDVDRLHLNVDERYIVNVGSVGQPRDGDPRASYVVWDYKHQFIEIKRVKYDWEAAAEKIGRVGLPSSLARRLLPGK